MMSCRLVSWNESSDENMFYRTFYKRRLHHLMLGQARLILTRIITSRRIHIWRMLYKTNFCRITRLIAKSVTVSWQFKKLSILQGLNSFSVNVTRRIILKRALRWSLSKGNIYLALSMEMERRLRLEQQTRLHSAWLYQLTTEVAEHRPSGLRLRYCWSHQDCVAWRPPVVLVSAFVRPICPRQHVENERPRSHRQSWGQPDRLQPRTCENTASEFCNGTGCKFLDRKPPFSGPCRRHEWSKTVLDCPWQSKRLHKFSCSIWNAEQNKWLKVKSQNLNVTKMTFTSNV